MSNDVQAPDKLEVPEILPKSKLSVPLIASYLSRNRTQADIARACQISPQAVSEYIQTHYEELEPLLDTDNGFIAMRCKQITSKAFGVIDGILDNPDSKHSLSSLGILSGIMIDKYRLLTGQSTQNIRTISTVIKQVDSSFLASLDQE